MAQLHFTARRYTAVAILLHWATVLLVLAVFVVGLGMVDLPETPERAARFDLHRSLGMSVFLLVGARLAWRLFHSPPPPPASMPDWQQRAARVTHLMLYLLLVLIPVTGYLYSAARGAAIGFFGWVRMPSLLSASEPLAEALKTVHVTADYLLLALVALHSGAALKHHFLDRDDTLARMLPFLRRG